MSLKLLHTADVHLGAPFGWLGENGKEQRRQLKDTFRAVVDLALRERVAAFLIAGDLFDSNSPSQDTIDLVRGQLARLAAPVVILPGTHDCFEAGSVYRKVALATAGSPPIHIFDDSHTSIEIGGFVTVHGNANCTKSSAVSPLQGLRPNPATRFNVALAHGSLPFPGAEADFPIAPSEIGEGGMQYVALGHWHSYRDCSVGATTACYSGPPELLTAAEPGRVLLVEIGEGGVKVEPRSLSRRRAASLDLSVDQVAGVEEILARVHALRDPDLCLAVTLRGLRPLSLVVEAERLRQELADAFFSLRVDDLSHPVLSPGEIAALPEKTVLGQFARRMEASLAAAADPTERRIREAALQLGLALLRGERVL